MSDAISQGQKNRRRLVQQTARQLRDLVFAAAPDTRIGGLSDLAGKLGVGITTVQQVARILEHEGLLDVRRGPSGGYYGRRPDALALERSMAAFMRMHPASFVEALDITSLLYTELVSAAARCSSETLRESLRELQSRMSASHTEADLLACETEMHDLLFRMVERPLFEVLTRVTMSLSGARLEMHPDEKIAQGRWREGRHRIIDAILANDAELARFEADRTNRRAVLHHVESLRSPDT